VLALSCHGGATVLQRGPVQVWPAAWGGLIVTHPWSEPALVKGELGTKTHFLLGPGIARAGTYCAEAVAATPPSRVDSRLR